LAPLIVKVEGGCQIPDRADRWASEHWQAAVGVRGVMLSPHLAAITI